MKLIDILKEIERSQQIYSESEEENSVKISELSPEQKKELFDKGHILVGNEVINLPKIDQKRKDVIHSKREFDIFTFYPDEDIKNVAKEINNLHNKLYRAMTALNKLIELKKSGRI